MRYLYLVLLMLATTLSLAQGPVSYPNARTDSCVGSVATPNFTPTSVAWSAGTATVTTSMNPGINNSVYLTGYTGSAVAWNLGWVKAITSSNLNFTFSYAPTLGNFSFGLGTVGFCNLSTTTGTFGASLVYQEGTSDPVPFFRLDADTSGINCPSGLPPFSADCAVAGVPFIDPDFNSYNIFLTDQSTSVNTTVHIVSSGGGAFDAFGVGSTTDVIYTWVNTGSNTFVAHILEANFLAHSCATSKCVVKSNVLGAGCTPTPGVYTGAGICTQTQLSNASVVMSRNASDPPNTLYEANLPVVIKTTFSTGNTTLTTGPANDTVTRTAYVNFGSDGGGAIPCHIVPSDYISTWNGVFKVADTGGITIASGGGGSYQSIWEQVGGSSTAGAPQIVTNDVFIMPVNNLIGGTNGNTFMFQASAGTTSGTEPNWAVSCPTQGSTCTDGTVTWTNIGKVNGQGPGFDILHFDPLRGCRRWNTRLAKLYNGTNEGVSWPATGIADAAGQIITDDAVVCFRMGGTNCGTGGTVALADKFTLHAGSQYFDTRYGSADVTGSGSLNKNYTGGGGTWPEISSVPNGSCTLPITYTSYVNWPNTLWISGSNYANGKYASSPANNAYYKLVTSAYVSTPSTLDPSVDSANWNSASAYCYNYIVDWYSNIVRPILEVGPNFGGDSHSAYGYAYDYRGGAYWYHYLYQPNCQTAIGICPYVGAPNPGNKLLTFTFPADGHPTTRNAGPGDLQPIIYPSTSVPAFGGVGMSMINGGGTGVGGYVAPGYNEECTITSPVERFGHNYNTASSPWFGTQNALGVISKDGKMLAYSSDFMNSRGDKNSGSATCVSPLRAQYQPGVGQCVSLNDITLSINKNSLNNIYQITNVGTVPGSCPGGQGTEAVEPNYNTSCAGVGNICTDANGVQFTNLGPNSCRGDIGLMDLNEFAVAGTTNTPAPEVIMLSSREDSSSNSIGK